jgi:hypothetical protein
MSGDDYGFSEFFWPVYPKKVGKKQAKAEWIKAATKGELPASGVIIHSLQRQITHKKRCKDRGVFCAEFQDPVRWIKNQRWSDEVPDETDIRTGKKTAADRAREAAERIEASLIEARNNSVDGSVVATINRAG